MTLINYSQSRLDFEQKLFESGLKHLPLFQAKPDTFQRFGKNKQYSILYDGKFGFFRDWSGELPDIYWFADSNKKESLTSEEIKKINQQIEAEKKAREEVLRIRNERAAKFAKIAWERLSCSGESEYLKKKHLSPISGIKFGKNRHGNFIATALIDNDDKIWATQFIYDKIPQGRQTNKEFSTGAKKKGNYSPFGNLDGDTIYICEGVATGLSISMAKPKSLVVVAYDCNNLEPVTKNILAKYSGKEIIVAADNDSSKDRNIGIEKAEAVAKKFDLKFVYPEFKNTYNNPSDFNDLDCIEGLDEVTKQLSNADYCDPEPILFFLKNPDVTLDIEEIFGKNVVTNFALEVANSTETPIDFSFISILCCIAACLQNKAAVIMGRGYKEPLILHAIILGKSGDGKSPVFNQVVSPILSWEKDKNEHFEKDLKDVQNFNNIINNQIALVSKPSSRKDTNFDTEEADKKVKALERKRKKEPPSPRIIVQDITPEQITKKLKAQGGKIAIFDHEGGFFNTVAGRYSGGVPNADALLKGYNGSELMVALSPKF